MPENNSEFSQEIIRKVSKTVLHAAERGREGLFRRLTAANADKVATLLEEKPIFYENKEDSKPEILLDDELAATLSNDFFEDPTKWIESQQNIKRNYTSPMRQLNEADKIEDLFSQPYDVTKVKEFRVGAEKGFNVVSKRIDQKQLAELARAQLAYEAGIPTPKVYGFVADKGNYYAMFEKIDALDLHAVMDKFFYSKGKGLNYTPDMGLNTLKKEMQESIGNVSPEQLSSFLELQREYLPYIEGYNYFSRYIKITNVIIDKWLSKEGSRDVDISFRSLDKSFSALDLPFKTHQDVVNYILSHVTSRTIDRDYAIDQESANFLINTALAFKVKYDEYRLKFDSIYAEAVVGFDYRKEVELLKKQCEEKGVEHKDFNDRNILVPWDFEQDKPKLEPNKPKLYLIDWEGEK